MKQLPTILVVDDDEDHLSIARRAIARMRLTAELRVARDGAEALCLMGLKPGATVALAPLPIAVVMLDLRMPGVSGWEVLTRMRESERTRRIPVVVVSASGRPEDVRRSYELGANSYMVKRYDPGQPGGYLAEAAHYWVELNEPARPRAVKTGRPV